MFVTGRVPEGHAITVYRSDKDKQWNIGFSVYTVCIAVHFLIFQAVICKKIQNICMLFANNC